MAKMFWVWDSGTAGQRSDGGAGELGGASAQGELLFGFLGDVRALISLPTCCQSEPQFGAWLAVCSLTPITSRGIPAG